MRVLSIGECMAELAPSDRPGDYRLGFAGDTFNTAWYLARIAPDVEVSYFTAVGTDAISQNMRAFVVASGIDDAHLRAVPDRTVGLYLITLDQGERSFSYWRGQSAARRLADDAGALQAAMDDADLIYFSGITLAILDGAARETLLDCLRKARSAGKRIVFDPNLRPRLWSDPSAMRAAIMQGAAVADVALPSYEDEAQWFGDADPAATAQRYADAGAATVIVKDGAEPVHFRDHGAAGVVPVAPVTAIVDTTAAGDSFNAAILAAFDAQMPLPDAIARAARLAARVVQAKGALVPVTSADLG
ncbi:sugar kinase [Thalassococcus sp. CAU 1522]|uniref:Sugar kinase n=1 Tax=Thalassococcus arenae TaxID=2851652 RepID=A0ABS6NC63_9RHOB|nr:sugar kinase [Thalassococcus arenae]MBV2361563.1 sugar kinase [Thalassococcus arenae]